MNLQIQCPKCSRRFQVHEDLTDKTVECGACDQRFKVTAETMVENRERFYPGEHKDALLERLGRKSARVGDGKVNFAPAQAAAKATRVDAVMPTSPGQRIAIFAGVSLLLFYALVFLLGSAEGQAFQDVLMPKRLLLGGFVSLIGGGLIIFGAKHWRIRAILFSLFLVGGLIALILVREVHVTPVDDGSVVLDEEVKDSPDENDPLAGLSDDEVEVKSRIGYGPIQNEMDRLTDIERGVEGRNLVVGIFIRNVKKSQLLAIEKYLKRKLFIPKTEAPVTYNRNGGKDRLVVFSGVTQKIDIVTQHCEALGSIKTHPNLRVIEVALSKKLFENPSPEHYKKMTDQAEDEFLSINIAELGHVDLVRVKQAVGRLEAVTEGVELSEQPRIVSELIRILRQESDGELIASAGSALRVWAAGDDATVATIGRILKSWSQKDRDIPKSLVEYLAENQSEEAVLVIDSLWSRNPERWSEQYASIGAAAEERLLFHLSDSPMNLKKAALSLLREVGTSKSLPTLQKLMKHEDSEIPVLATRAISAIKGR